MGWFYPPHFQLFITKTKNFYIAEQSKEVSSKKLNAFFENQFIELGIDPEELGGSAYEAAFTSFFLFAVGAVFPIFPFFFWTGATAIYLSLAISGVGLFIIGAAITLMTGRGVMFSGMRQVLVGLAAAALTFGVGKLIGVSLA